jgi:hypothetical protein
MVTHFVGEAVAATICLAAPALPDWSSPGLRRKPAPAPAPLGGAPDPARRAKIFFERA